jgi:hypothetical protein
LNQYILPGSFVVEKEMPRLQVHLIGGSGSVAGVIEVASAPTNQGRDPLQRMALTFGLIGIHQALINYRGGFFLWNPHTRLLLELFEGPSLPFS